MEELPKNSLVTGDPLEQQVGGDHYSKYRIQPVEIMQELNLDFVRGNILKYLVRYKDKNGIEDLKKAFHYSRILLDKQLEYCGMVRKFIEQFEGRGSGIVAALHALFKQATDIPMLQDELIHLIRKESGAVDEPRAHEYDASASIEDDDSLP